MTRLILSTSDMKELHLTVLYYKKDACMQFLKYCDFPDLKLFEECEKLLSSQFEDFIHEKMIFNDLFDHRLQNYKNLS